MDQAWRSSEVEGGSGNPEPAAETPPLEGLRGSRPPPPSPPSPPTLPECISHIVFLASKAKSPKAKPETKVNWIVMIGKVNYAA